jgi:hypothetical protein
MYRPAASPLPRRFRSAAPAPRHAAALLHPHTQPHSSRAQAAYSTVAIISRTIWRGLLAAATSAAAVLANCTW